MTGDGRIVVTYAADAAGPQLADAIRVEQTIEFPYDEAAPWIQQEVVGRIEELTDGRIVVSYDPRTVNGDLVQLLNLLWGNVSLFPGVRIVGVDLPDEVCGWFRGPRFGIAGLREVFGAPARPLVATALKPMGLSAARLAADAAVLATAGFDIVKDDHGLANQPWAPWRERVATVGAAVNDANAAAGTRAVYMPALNVPADRVVAAAHEAKRAGAGALLVLPGLVGLDTMRALADDDELALPIMSHPSFLGSHVVNPGQGIDHGLLLGLLLRLAGADITVFPNHGGRFSFTPEQCIDIRDRCREPLPGIRPAWPSPGGGMSVDRITEMVGFYGPDVTLLIGGALHHGDLARNARAMVEAVHGAAGR